MRQGEIYHVPLNLVPGGSDAHAFATNEIESMETDGSGLPGIWGAPRACGWTSATRST